MTWDDLGHEQQSLDELVAQRNSHQPVWQITAMLTGAVVSLAVSVLLLWSGRSLWNHATGYLLAAIVAPTAASFAARLASSRKRLRASEATVIRRLFVLNLFGMLIAVVHAAYIARRLW